MMRADSVRFKAPLPLAILLGIAAGIAPVAVVLLTVQTPPAPPAPAVTLGNATADVGMFVVAIVESEPSRPLREFGATLLRNGFQSDVIPRLSVSAGGMFRFEDRADLGALSVGDRFTSRWMDDGHYEIRVTWQQQTLASATWDIAQPNVTFAPASIQEEWVNVSVSSADPRVPLFDFRASLWYDGTLISNIDPLDAPSGYPFAFADVDGDAELSPGDRFTSYWVYPYPYELRLEYRGSLLATAAWTVYAPNVTMVLDGVGPTTFWFNVTGAQPLWRLSNYEALAARDGSTVDEMSEVVNGTAPGGILSFEDRDGDGMVSVGDRFVVEAGAAGNWELAVSWHQYEIRRFQWTV